MLSYAAWKLLINNNLRLKRYADYADTKASVCALLAPNLKVNTIRYTTLYRRWRLLQHEQGLKDIIYKYTRIKPANWLSDWDIARTANSIDRQVYRKHFILKDFWLKWGVDKDLMRIFAKINRAKRIKAMKLKNSNDVGRQGMINRGFYMIPKIKYKYTMFGKVLLIK